MNTHRAAKKGLSPGDVVVLCDAATIRGMLGDRLRSGKWVFFNDSTGLLLVKPEQVRPVRRTEKDEDA